MPIILSDIELQEHGHAMDQIKDLASSREVLLLEVEANSDTVKIN